MLQKHVYMQKNKENRSLINQQKVRIVHKITCETPSNVYIFTVLSVQHTFNIFRQAVPQTDKQ